MVNLFRNKTFQAYLLFLIMIALVSYVAYTNLNPVTVSGWNKQFSRRVSNMTVSEFLNHTGIIQEAAGKNAMVVDDTGALTTKGNYIMCNVKLGQMITGRTSMKLSYMEVQELPVDISLPFAVTVKKTTNLLPGQRRIVKKGSVGLKKIIFRVVLKDGKLFERKQVAFATLREPVNQVIEEGAPFVKVSRGKTIKVNRLTPKNTYIFGSTAYTHTGYRTATGIKPRRGVVAVDPRVIALGTKLHIEGYGYAVAADTGGAIKGNKVDVFFETRDEAIKWGRRKVKVTILG